MKVGVKKGTTEDKCNAWKGDNASYSALHKWITKKRGTPNYCEECKISSAPQGKGLTRSYFHWANISRNYKRIITDWKRLCVKCHARFDKGCGRGRPRKS